MIAPAIVVGRGGRDRWVVLMYRSVFDRKTAGNKAGNGTACLHRWLDYWKWQPKVRLSVDVTWIIVISVCP